MEPGHKLAEALAAAAAHFDAEGLACDFAALAASRERGHLAVCLAELETFDPGQVRIGAQMAFWVNVFNAGVLRDAPELAFAGHEDERHAFFGRPRLSIFGQRYSLDDIYHGLLRGNAPAHGRLQAPMPRDDPRLAHVPIALDERLHFALYCGARSSPAFRVFESGRLDTELEDAGARYVQRLARLDDDGSTLTAPKLMQWYAADFGGPVLDFVRRYSTAERIAQLNEAGAKPKVRFFDYDWAINEPGSRAKAPLAFERELARKK
jgi:hypothetical protein